MTSGGDIYITQKALFDTGWGVVNNKSKADFVIDTTLKDFAAHWVYIAKKYRKK